MTTTVSSARAGLEDLVSFELPAHLEASAPPESRGIPRDRVRMLVASSGGRLEHRHFYELPEILDEGDLVVVNTSATLPAALEARGRRGDKLRLHLSTRLPGGLFTIELRKDNGPYLHARVGELLELADGGLVHLLAPYSRASGGVRLWVVDLSIPDELVAYLLRHGRPIRYGYVTQQFPLSAYQNVYATEYGSAEMPSAGRPFTSEVFVALAAAGIGVSPLILHTGVSSLEASEPPYLEHFVIPETTARRVNETRRARQRVVAIGTTVVRALETAVDHNGKVHPARGWTDTVISRDTKVSSIDGLLTGWHEPAASHLAMLEAVAGRGLVEASYASALDAGYLWHEFGDVHLILR